MGFRTMASDAQFFPSKSKNLQFIIFATVCVAIMFFLGQMIEISKCQTFIKSTMLLQAKSDNFMTVSEFKALNEKILQEPKRLCDCGCTDSPDINCERKYLLKDVEKSAYVMKTKEISEYMELELQFSKKAARIACVRDNGRRPDGYCIEHMMENQQESSRSRGVVVIPFPSSEIVLPACQLPESEMLLESLYLFIEREKLTSINEFGAGIGQYGTHLRRKNVEELVYRGYDYAGDVERYTESFISYFDLGIPLNLPVADWVISFETGHLLAPHKEGMMIRNLHAHNCKGIILTWGTDGQTDLLRSTNLHDENYLLDIFSRLGYQNDLKETKRIRDHWNPEKDGPWFHDSLLVLRRRNPIC